MELKLELKLNSLAYQNAGFLQRQSNSVLEGRRSFPHSRDEIKPCGDQNTFPPRIFENDRLENRLVEIGPKNL